MKRLRKNGVKMILDIIMAVVLALMYNKRVLGMSFHEIGGIALCGLFIIHKLLNWQWIKAVTAGMFSRNTPARLKLFWVLDILLFACFTYILVSGIMISKVVFPSTGGGMAFKAGHYAVAAIALALVGVHIGLHMGWIGQRMGFLKKMPLLLRRGLAVVLSVLVLGFGAYALTDTSFTRWVGNISQVFSSSQAADMDAGGERAVYLTAEQTDTQTATGDALTLETVATDTQAQTSNLTTDSLTQTATVATDTLAQDTAAGDTGEQQRRGQGGMGAGGGQGQHGEGGEAGSADVGSVILSFMSIMLAFAILAAWTDRGLMAAKRRRLRMLLARENAQP